jgi:hypothetical protein
MSEEKDKLICYFCKCEIYSDDKKVAHYGDYIHMTCQGSFGNRKSSSGRDWNF